ncbi:MAG: hypothetical protein QM715_06190 [Nibricoccus sp.]
MKKLLLLSAFAIVLSGCMSTVSPGTSRIWEERAVTHANHTQGLELKEPLNWFAKEFFDRYDVFLPAGKYVLESEDADYLYFGAPEKVGYVVAKSGVAPDSRQLAGGIFLAKADRSPYPAGAYIEWEGGKRLLLMRFDFAFTSQKGKRWFLTP